MKEKFKNLGRALSKEEQKKIGGGTLGTCTYNYNCDGGSISCSSTSGDCQNLYCVFEMSSIKIGICCDHTEYECNGVGSCNGTKVCAP
jgi:hypothetical protein